MTGSIDGYTRQHSETTTTDSNMEESKVRQCSSVDNDNDNVVQLIVNQKDEFFFSKRQRRITDEDSGTEEIEQQLEQIYLTTSNVSKKNSIVIPDEGFSEWEIEPKSQFSSIQNDLNLAKKIPDEMKKDFCSDTSVTFHAEFARLISIPLSLCHSARYYLFAEEEILRGSNLLSDCNFVKLDNAKAQFKCPNSFCEHAWTSMRARISFSISGPEPGFVLLKIFGQNCQRCATHTDALWYIDEVCRVMKNLAKFIFETYFPDMINNVDLEYQIPTKTSSKPTRFSRHDPSQRKGKMFAPHVKEYCEACRRGLCYI